MAQGVLEIREHPFWCDFTNVWAFLMLLVPRVRAQGSVSDMQNNESCKNIDSLHLANGLLG